MSALAQPAAPGPDGGFSGQGLTTVLDVVIPVYNEEAQLADSVGRVLEHLRGMPWTFQVTIADNASTDQTALIARRLSHAHPQVSVVHLQEKGRGRALKRAWSASESDVLVYMDVDLSTDLGALLPLVAPLVSGHSDLAIGSRLARTARVRRGAKRELISRSYNLILRQALRARFSDAQCGFKAIRADRARLLLPYVADTGWFFDTELLVLAERAGLRIHEVPVDWTDDPDSSVDIVRTALDDLKGVARLGRSLVRGDLLLREVGERLGRTSERPSRAMPNRSSIAVRTMSTRLSGSSVQSTGTSWIRRPARSATTSSSVSKNQPWSATSGSSWRTASERTALNPHCASEKRAPSAPRRIKL